ncbi:hypothetical protein EJ065_0041 [Corallococcus coralloides]|uniref:Uncharacterized protein n=1 Tax=Corallococcus coralloides TaxID=184914 RepID=A0A410RIK0_CORCK|nr:hypothetical protein [Corallococcus coralloides]QAT81656.1 hypothetical protein EJ065_0041 [Corallococcus coralloides]
MPREVLRDTNVLDAAISAILSSDISSEVRFVPSVAEGWENTWRMMAERGVFAFDADVHGGPYMLVAEPANPIRVEDPPESVATVARQITLKGLDFSGLKVIAGELIQSGSQK